MSKVTKEYLLGFFSLLLVIVLALGFMQKDLSVQDNSPTSEVELNVLATDHNHHDDLPFSPITRQKGLNLSASTPMGDVAYHTCSMHPSVKSATSGTCPICGMDLISVTHDELNSGSIIVEEGRRQTIGIKTGKVVSEHFAVPVRLQGEVTVDPRRLSDISLRFDGWVGDLRADFVGKSVKQSDMLFTVYSPKLLTLQEEYLATFKQGKNNRVLLKAARKRLKLWGLSATQISWLERQGQASDYLPIFSPGSLSGFLSGNGVVIEKNIVSGSAFKKGQRLLRLADLSSVWVEAFAYEQDLALIEQGMLAKVQLSNFPGQDFSAEVMHVDPFLGVSTRTARVQLVLDNKLGQFKPGLFAKVTLQANLGEQLLIPQEAVLVSGDKRIVFIDLGEGRLKPKEIRTGYSDGVNVVVRDGLSAGDIIVTSGNFLVASESKLKSGLDQW